MNKFAEPGLNAFFHQLVDSWQDGVLLLDDRFTIRYCNAVFQNMIKSELLVADSDLAGSSLETAFKGVLAEQLAGQAGAVFRADDGHWLSDHMILPDTQGSERHFSLQALPLLAKNEETTLESAYSAAQTKWVAICLKNISALIRHEIRGNELELELQQNSLRDEVTGLSSRAYWESWLTSEFNRSKRYQQDLSIVLVDLATHQENLSELPVEAFVNVLADIAQLIQCVLRNSDQAARYSEKRIAALLPHTNGVGAENLAARMSAKIAEYLEEHELQQWVEFRIGVAVFHGSVRDNEVVIERYDDLLQLAEDDLLS